MKKYKYRSLICALIMSTGLVSCANNPDEVTERPLPSYATPVISSQGFNTWTVRCPMQAITGLDDRDTSMFYKSNRMTKSLTEFCDEYDATTRIRGDSAEN